MSRLVRMTYGHGGSRLRRIHVCSGYVECRPEPLWLRLLFVMILLAVPFLVCRYGVPTVPHRETLIDVGRLALQPIAESPPHIPEKQPAPQVELRPPEPDRVPQRATPSEDIQQPAITRPRATTPPEEYAPRIARQRLQPDAEPVATSAPPVRRAVTPDNAATPQVGIQRSRQAVTTDAGADSQRPAAVRRAPSPENIPQSPVPGRPLRSTHPPSERFAEGPAPVSHARGRTETARVEEGSSTLQPTRGVSLMNLEICSGSHQEEDLIKAVLGIIGSRRSCANDKGTFEFTGTKRISSFNLIIYPGKGRRPSNRCEELENAYRCLKTR